MRIAIPALLMLLTTACGQEGANDAENVGRVTEPPALDPAKPASAPEPPPAQATVELSPTQGHEAAGQVTLTSQASGVRIAGSVRGLKPNSAHGIHIHEKGDCSAPDASSAGGHFAPLGHPHGAPGLDSHVGDLGNVTANDEGVAQIEAQAPQATLRNGASTDLVGRAVVLHANADDLKSQPSGESGARIACGVIE